MFLTPSGRFETGTKICLSFSAYHPELWQPAWGIRLILEALISFLPTPADGAIGALDWTPEERKRLAKKSVDFCCPRCGNAAALLPEIEEGAEKKPARFAKEIEQLQKLQAESETRDKTGEGKLTEETREEAKEEFAPLIEESADEPVPDADEALPVRAPEPQQPQPHAAVAEDTPAAAEQVDQENELVVPPAEQQAAIEESPKVEIDWSWCTDNFVHTCMLIMSLLLYLLWRKGYALFSEIKAINEELAVPNV